MKVFLQFMVLLLSCNAQAEADRGLFWRIQSQTATVYLLGSIHYADASFYPLRNEIEQAFEQADQLVLEVNLDAAAGDEVNALLQEQGMYRGADTIRDHIDAETYTRLVALLQQLDIPYALVARQKPGLLLMTLTSVQMMRLGLVPEQGIDAHFLRRAQTQPKPVLELETVQQQIDLILAIADGDLLLQEMFTSFDQVEDDMRTLVAAWKQGDENQLNTLLFTDMLAQYPEYQSIYEELFYKRNIAMAKKIEDYLKTSNTYFVIIGAGHLIGDKSVLSLLKKNNHKVVRN